MWIEINFNSFLDAITTVDSEDFCPIIPIFHCSSTPLLHSSIFFVLDQSPIDIPSPGFLFLQQELSRFGYGRLKRGSPHGLKPVPARRSALRHAGVAPPHASWGGPLRSIPHYARMSFVGHPPRIHPRSQRPWLSE